MITQISPLVFLYDARLAAPSVSANAIALPQHPSDVFGDGSHPTTQLCAGAVDLLCRQRMPASVLDVGTGTGVLARIARARGASFVVGTDIDARALSSAQTHCALDRHPIPIQITQASPDHWGARFDLIIANILEEPLRELAPALSRALAPAGTLHLSGFTRLQTPALRVAFSEQQLEYVNESHLDDWALLMFQR